MKALNLIGRKEATHLILPPSGDLAIMDLERLLVERPKTKIAFP
jgi:hypothetical protein